MTLEALCQFNFSINDECVIDVDSFEEPVKEQTLERPSSKSTKRPLGQTNHVTSATKRIKLTPEIEEKYKIKSLVNLADFMKNKRLKKLTRADLEEFCVQKICEVIVHKSEIGDINQQLRLYEQMVEQLRKDQQQLNKQVRDLEIVNKKLMQELKCKDNQKKPLVPLKITRSVGLQVKLTVPDMTVKRRPVLPPPQQKTVLPAPVNNNRIQQRPAQTNTTPSVLSPRPVVQSPQKQTPTPILTSVLQNRRTSQGTPVKTSPAQPIRPKPSENKGGSVIDLTDEDDKKNEKKVEASPKKVEPPTKKAVANTVTTPGRTVATIGQGVRLTTPTQVKTTPITGVTTSTPQLMYVLQPGTQLSSGVITTAAGGTQKAVLLNFQSNGILTTPTLNGSAVSVIPKATSTVQAKPAVQPKPVIRQVSRHPAPLPIAPVARLPNEKSLKPVPPKPYLSIRKTDTGIILQWRMPYDLDMYEVIASYQLYAYQETSSPPTTDMWRRVGDVKALALPMACTLTQFADKNKYYFAVRPVDIYKRIGAFSDPEEISL